MDYLEIIGQKSLRGEVQISGAKNAALPLIAMSILAKNSIKISNIPDVADIKTLIKLLEMLGAKTDFLDKNCVQIDSSTINSTKATYDIVRKMRASILVLGPLLARFKHCEVSLPGGCAIGARPIDLHLSALEKMGAQIEIKDGYVVAKALNGLKGAKIVFDKITVTGSENIIMAASLADGITHIVNAAIEPEVVQLCEILNESGIKIEGIGSSELKIYGNSGKLIDIKDFEVIPDRIEAGTYLCAGAITNSNIILKKVQPKHLSIIISKLEKMGFSFDIKENSIEIFPSKELLSTDITTTEYPGFPTDMQAQFMALSTIANGASTFKERLFENRFMHASELARMGADIKIDGNLATVNGIKELKGADVMATDLRASSALVLAALVAKGKTKIHRIYHLDRGYENLEGKLVKLGADVKRKKEE